MLSRTNGKRAWLTVALGAAAAVALPAQTFTTLFNFNSANGGYPTAALVQATNGDLYGTTWQGGTLNDGTIFKVSKTGTVSTVWNFCSLPGGLLNCGDGGGPWGGLVQDANGELYGTAYQGGTGPYGAGGVVFKISLAGDLTPIYSFCNLQNCADGESPFAGLVPDGKGAFYGTTRSGGKYSDGTIFKITPSGSLTTLYSFCSLPNCADGVGPIGTLVLGTDGDLYGTTQSGGAYCAPDGCGTVFKISPRGKRIWVYSFCSQTGCPDGIDPIGGLIQATNGNFYGTTAADGYPGTIFEITPAGDLTTLFSSSDFDPWSGLVQGSDGNLYGTSIGGGNGNDGTIVVISPDGGPVTSYSVCAQTGCGTYPEGALVQNTNGTFYGTNSGGGDSTGCAAGNGCGTVFSFSVGLGPFVEPQTTSGAVGATVKILGTGLTKASSVTFNGTSATFTVVSSSEITATVPTGATSGTIQVVTPKATLSSNVPFQVQ